MAESFIDALLAKINKKHGHTVIMRASQAKGLPIYKASTGSIALDIDLGGGIALGRLSQIVGQFSSGKSVICALTGRSFLEGRIIPYPDDYDRSNYYVVYVDLENSFEPLWVEYLAGNLDHFLLCKPVGGEEAWDVVCEVMDGTLNAEKKIHTLFVIDSISALFPMKETNRELEDSNATPGAQAKLISDGIKKFIPRLQRVMTESGNNTMIFVNQTRLKIGNVFHQDPEQAMGGKAPGFFSSQIIYVNRGESIARTDKQGKPLVGFKIKYTIRKEKTGGAEKTSGEMSFYRNPDESKGIYGGEIDNASDILPYAERYEVIERRGSHYYYQNQKLGAGADQASATLRADRNLYEEIAAATLFKMRSERIEYADRKAALSAANALGVTKKPLKRKIRAGK